MDMKFNRQDFDKDKGNKPQQHSWMLSDHERILALWRSLGFDDIEDKGDSLTFFSNRGTTTESRVTVAPHRISFSGHFTLETRHQAFMAAMAHIQTEWGGVCSMLELEKSSEAENLRRWAYCELSGVTVRNYRPAPEQEAAARAMLAEVRKLIGTQKPAVPVVVSRPVATALSA